MATQEELDGLRSARRKIVTGEKLVSMSMHGRNYTYGEADIPRLDAEIEKLERELGFKNGRRRGPARVL